MALENPPVMLNRDKATRRRHCRECGHVQLTSSWKRLPLYRHSCVRMHEGGKIVLMVQWPGGA